jgi:hypothetical protein
MALATTQDRQSLQSQNLFSDYQNNKTHFVDLAKVVYTAIEGKMGSAPNETDILTGLVKTIRERSITFAAMLKRRPFMNTSLYGAYADALARVLLDDEWTVIKV